MFRKLASLALILFCLIGVQAPAQTDADTAKSLRVIDDHGKPVQADVFAIAGAEKTKIGTTNDKGVLALEDATAGARLAVTPQDAAWLKAQSRVPESGRRTVIVTKKTLLENLQANAAALEKKDLLAKAAFVHNEIYQRARAFDAELAEKAQTKVYDCFAKHLKIEMPLKHDPVQGKDVISPEYKAAIAKYQSEIGHADGAGRIDYQTLSAAADGPIGVYLFTRIKGAEEPPTKTPAKKADDDKPTSAPADDQPTSPPAKAE